MSNRLLFSGSVRLHSQQAIQRAGKPFSAMIHSAWRRYRSRHGIAELDRHLLKDIGITFAEAEAEANKPFWRE